MKKIPSSVRQWALSFLVADAAFWVLVLASCALNRVECLEAFTFGPYFFYLPVALLLDVVSRSLTSLTALSFPWMVALLAGFGIASHALVGAGIGWLLRGRPLRWFVTVPIAVALTLGVSYAFAAQQWRAEMAREVSTELLEIVEPTANAFSYREVIMTQTPDGPSPVAFTTLDGLGWQGLENTSRTKVQLICNSDACAGVAVDGYVELGWDAYVAAHNACKADPTTCPYYNIGVYDLFDVMMDPEGIIVMTERYSP